MKNKNNKIWKLGSAILLLLIFFTITNFLGNDGQELAAGKPQETSTEATYGMEVHFIDIGQGDATLIKCGDHAMLIDAGDYNKGTAIQRYLKEQDISKLDYVVGTHKDSDHIGGMDVVITKFDCDVIILPEYKDDTISYRNFVSAMNQKGYQFTQPVVGASYKLGDAEFTILAPNSNYYEDNNNYSVGIRLVYGQDSFIFTGDAEVESENEILESGATVKADVLKVGHHGSSASTSRAFLEAVSPTYAIISCGKDNDYGHPHRETVKILRDYGIKSFRTDELGSIIAFCDGENIFFQCEKSDAWSEGNDEETTKQ